MSLKKSGDLCVQARADPVGDISERQLSEEVEQGKLVKSHRVVSFSCTLSRSRGGIVPGTRQRLPFDSRWPGVMHKALNVGGERIRVTEDCLNGRRTVFDDQYKPGRNALAGIQQVIEAQSPLDFVILLLGTNDFQSMYPHNPWRAAKVCVTASRICDVGSRKGTRRPCQIHRRGWGESLLRRASVMMCGPTS